MRASAGCRLRRACSCLSARHTAPTGRSCCVTTSRPTTPTSGQRRADHAAGRRHRASDQRRRHRVRQGGRHARRARPGRREGRARAGRGEAGADGARGARTVRDDGAAEGSRSTCATPSVARATEDLNRRQRLASTGAVSRRRAAARARRADERTRGAGRRAAAARGEPGAHRPHDASRAIRTCWPPPRRCARRISTSRAPQLPAPVSGYVAKRTVQLGQRVAPGTPLMAIVPLDQVWVDANSRRRSSRTCASASR